MKKMVLLIRIFLAKKPCRFISMWTYACMAAFLLGFVLFCLLAKNAENMKVWSEN
jgi:hypothetical protein